MIAAHIDHILDAIQASLFYQLAALLILTGVIGAIFQMLRQPLIIAYIAVGLVVGLDTLGVLTENSISFDALASLGIALLLFLVGIKLDMKLIRSLGLVSLTTGLGQVAFTSIIGFLIAIWLGFNAVTSLYIAVALTFSSTIIIVKLLSDKREIDALHGRIALGFLIVQDIVVVLAMIVLSALGVGSQEDASVLEVLSVLGASLGMLAFVLLFVRYGANAVTEFLARSPELLLAFAIALAAFFAALGDIFGFGKELGGLLAGVALASTPYRESISARMVPLRDFLLLFFFIGLGSRLDLSLLGEHINASLIFSAFVLIGNPLIVMIIMGVMGYHKRTGFLAGLTVAQISEFSLIFMAMGLAIGHVDEAALGLVTLVGLITIAVSTYMITYSHVLYNWFEPFLGPFERKNIKTIEELSSSSTKKKKYDVILFGLGRYGLGMAEQFRSKGQKVLGVDFNPETIREVRRKGLPTVYGDAGDPEFVSSLPLKNAHSVILAIPQMVNGPNLNDIRLSFIKSFREIGYQGHIAVTSHNREDEALLKEQGADLILCPYTDAALRAANQIVESFNQNTKLQKTLAKAAQ